MRNTTVFTFALIAALPLWLSAPVTAAVDRGQEGATGSAERAKPDKADSESDAGRDKDNTGVDKRDRDENAETAGRQKNAKSDVKLTAEIRRAITKDKSLSMNAHNVKIIAKDGKVTLKGPVATAEEKKTVEDKAEEIAGAGAITSEIEVKQK